MTILEKKSKRKKEAIMQLVATGEYSIAFAMMEAERLNDEGKLLDNDYEELAEYLENLLNPVEEIEIDTGEETGIKEETTDTNVATIEETTIDELSPVEELSESEVEE